MEWLRKRGLLEFVTITANTFFDGVLPSVPGCYQRVHDMFEDKTSGRLRNSEEQQGRER